VSNNTDIKSCAGFRSDLDISIVTINRWSRVKLSRFSIAIFILCLLAPLISQSAWAQTSQGFILSGMVSEVTDSSNLLAGAVHTGDVVSGVLYYNLDAVDSNGAPKIGAYWHHTNPYGIFVRINGLNFRTDPAQVDFLARTENNLGGRDKLALRSYNNIFPGAMVSNPWSYSRISWKLTDSAAAALSNTDLPASINLSDWDNKYTLKLTYVNFSFPPRFMRIKVIVNDIDSQTFGDPEIPVANDSNCQLCHGSNEAGYDPNIAAISKSTQSLTLGGRVRFHNLYFLEATKVEKDSNNGINGTTPTIDLGDASPLQPATDHFWTRIAGNAPYTETFSWDDFKSPNTNTPVSGSNAWLKVLVTNSNITSLVLNGGKHPNSGTHPPTNPSNWERVTLNVTPPWTAPPGAYWNTLDIVVTQQ